MSLYPCYNPVSILLTRWILFACFKRLAIMAIDPIENWHVMEYRDHAKSLFFSLFSNAKSARNYKQKDHNMGNSPTMQKLCRNFCLQSLLCLFFSYLYLSYSLMPTAVMSLIANSGISH